MLYTVKKCILKFWNCVFEIAYLKLCNLSGEASALLYCEEQSFKKQF